MTLREQLLHLFKESGNQFLSGEEVSKKLGVSRTAVWKHIEELREEGYIFEAVRRSGYRLVTTPDVIIAEEISLGLETKELGQKIYYYASVDSTNNKCQELAKNGAPHGTLVVAEEQVGGKGRLGRVWFSPKGKNIFMSFILRPNLEIQRCPQLTLLSAVSIVEVIREYYGIDASIKWPNDVLIKGKKICGILTELNAEADRINWVIIGIGINVNIDEKDLPPEVLEVATSLRMEKGEKLLRVPLIQQILKRFEELYDLYLAEGFLPIKGRWEKQAITIGKKVTIRTLQGSFTGIAEGIDETGVLLVRKEDGTIQQVYSADVEIHP